MIVAYRLEQSAHITLSDTMNPWNRREFLSLAGTAVLAQSVITQSRAEDAPAAPLKVRKNVRKGIMWGTVGGDGTVAEKFQTLKEVGFAGVEPNSHMNQDEVLKARDATGLELPSVCCSTHWAKPLSHPSEKVREEGREGLKQALRDAKRYGSRSVLFVAGVVNESISYDDCYHRTQAEIRKVLPLAEELGVKIALENVWNNFLLSPMEAARYVDEFQSPAVGWHFDVGNVINYGWPEQWIRILGKRIVTLHIKEFSREKAEKYGKGAGFNAEFLTGSNRWPKVMAALDEVGFDGWGIAEQGGGESAKGLKKLSDEMNIIFGS
ncbi:MAG TPA: sugar phosphate isomerase/epimerase family protein [Candidatus Limnocylindria bacterium]|nr:sugar phosphate isomerase/epimerase family protein [Candidatus Limnocylindria bacterium]